MPAAAIHWDPADANVFSGTPKLYFDGTNASIGNMMLYSNLDTGEYGTAKIPVTDDTLILSLDNTYGDDSAIFIKVDQAGRYTGKIANGSDTVTFDFTTTGTPTAITLTPAAQDVTVGETGTVTMALVDAGGNATAPTFTSTVSIAETGAGGSGPDPAAVNPGAQASADDTAWALGSVDIDDAALTAGTTTLTASGSGNLLGLSASATMTAAGGISDDTVVGMYVSAPSTGVWNEFDAATASYPPGALNSQVKAGTTSLTVTVDDTASNEAGNPIRLEITPSAGGSATAGGKTATNSVPTYVDITPSSGVATLDMVIGGASALAGGTVTLQQVNVNNTTAGIGANSTLTITQVVPTIYASGITVTPTGDSVAKIGSSTSVFVSIDDSLGDPASGQLVSAFRGNGTLPNSANLLDYSTTGSDGGTSVAVEGASGVVNGDAETYYFTVSGYDSGGTYLSDTLTVTYTTDGGVSWMTVVGKASGTSFGTDASGDVDPTKYVITDVPDITGATGDTASTGALTIATGAETAATSSIAEFRVETDPNNAFNVSMMSQDVYVLCSDSALSGNMWDDGAPAADCSSDDSVYVWGTKTGDLNFTVTSGGLSATGTIVVTNSSDDAYNIGISPSEQSLAAGALGTAVISVTDVFGNPVAAGDDTGVVTVTASGQVLLAGYAQTQNVSTGADGTATVTIIAANASGTGTLSAGPKSGDAAPAWQTGYTAPTNAPDPITSAAATVLVSESSVKTITITGERGTVKGKPGIMVDGITTGFDEGDLMVPYIKFPGETSYSEGSARPAVDADGEFYWQRKTGKKIYIYFKNEDGTVKSDRIIIQAK